MSSQNGKDNSGPARTRYWLKHNKPEKKLRKLSNMQKRLYAEDVTLIQRLADLGHRSDVAVLRLSPRDLQYNRAFAEHQQKLRGAIDRFRRRGAFQPLPRRVLIEQFKAAFNSTGGRK